MTRSRVRLSRVKPKNKARTPGPSQNGANGRGFSGKNLFCHRMQVSWANKESQVSLEKPSLVSPFLRGFAFQKPKTTKNQQNIIPEKKCLRLEKNHPSSTIKSSIKASINFNVSSQKNVRRNTTNLVSANTFLSRAACLSTFFGTLKNNMKRLRANFVDLVLFKTS